MIRIQTEGSVFAPGEPVRGKVILDLEDRVSAEALRVTLTASRRIERPLSSEPNTRHVVFERVCELDGERDYQAEEFTFELRLPEPSQLEEIEPRGPALLWKLLSLISPWEIGPVTYELTAQLDRGWKRDLAARAPLSERRAA